METIIGCETCIYGYLAIDGAGYYCKQPEYKKIECVKNKLAHYVTQLETTCESCTNCTYLGIREDSSKFCMIPGKELCDKACNLYKSVETAMTERTERTKLREAVQFLQTYCETHQGNCKGCPFNYNDELGCALAQLPENWNMDLLK